MNLIVQGKDIPTPSLKHLAKLSGAAAIEALSLTAFRLRAVLFDTHPELYNFVPLLQVLPPCSTDCGAQERRCDLDRVCYPAGEPTCLRCSTLPVEVCACQLSTGPAPPGQECDFFVSGDVMVSGACAGGECRQ